jgi:hypothetical protein
MSCRGLFENLRQPIRHDEFHRVSDGQDGGISFRGGRRANLSILVLLREHSLGLGLRGTSLCLRHPSGPDSVSTIACRSSTLDLANPNVILPTGIWTCRRVCEKGLHWLPARCHDGCMLHKKDRKEPGNATRASVTKEMAKPRMAKSARIAEVNLAATRIPEQPSTTMPGTVEEIFPSRRPSQPEKAQIAVEGADHEYRDLRIENTLTDENGDDVRLKKGAHVEVTVTANAKT